MNKLLPKRFVLHFVFTVLFCIAELGYCEIIKAPSSWGNKYTYVIPIHSNGVMKAYAAKDDIDSTVCWSNYSVDGRFLVRIFFECLSDGCHNWLSNEFSEGINKNEITRWGSVDAKFLSTWSADMIFDLPSANHITLKQLYFDKWGALMGSIDNIAIKEELSEQYPFSFAVANKINNILAMQLQDAKENKQSCLYMERRIINQKRLPGY